MSDYNLVSDNVRADILNSIFDLLYITMQEHFEIFHTQFRATKSNTS